MGREGCGWVVTRRFNVNVLELAVDDDEHDPCIRALLDMNDDDGG